jgi:hypothetical protein
MWEFRLTWRATPPPWWKQAWQDGLRVVGARNQGPERRNDEYILIPTRLDISIKVRGEQDIDVKVLHQRAGLWELWEKCAFVKDNDWDGLEAARLATALRLPARAQANPVTTSATEGVQALLNGCEVATTRFKVSKTRVQAAANDLLGHKAPVDTQNRPLMDT